MAVTLYAGSFSRFFLVDWEAEGLDDIDDLDDSDDDDEDDDEEDDTDGEDGGEPSQEDIDDICAFFEDFRHEMQEALKEHAKSPFQWQEDPKGEYQAQAIGSDAFGALMIIVARHATPVRGARPVDPRIEWIKDPAVRSLQGADRDLTTAHHLVNADAWLPGDFIAIASAQLPDRELTLGSLAKLAEALKQVEPIISETAPLPEGVSSMLVAKAKPAHSVFTRIVAFAQQKRLPVIVEL